MELEERIANVENALQWMPTEADYCHKRIEFRVACMAESVVWWKAEAENAEFA